MAQTRVALEMQDYVSRATYELIRDEFECKRRRMVDVKGIGEIEMWFVTGLIDHPQ